MSRFTERESGALLKPERLTGNVSGRRQNQRHIEPILARDVLLTSAVNSFIHFLRQLLPAGGPEVDSDQDQLQCSNVQLDQIMRSEPSNKSVAKQSRSFAIVKNRFYLCCFLIL